MSQNSPLSASNPSRSQAASPGRLVRKTAVELVVDELRDRILSGALPPGSRCARNCSPRNWG